MEKMNNKVGGDATTVRINQIKERTVGMGVGQNDDEEMR